MSHKVFQQWMGCIGVVVERTLEIQQDVSTDIKSNKVGQGQGAHRVLVAKHHGCIDVLGAGDTVSEHSDGFVAEDDTEAARGEARNVLDQNACFSHRLARFLRRGDGVLRGALMANQFKQLHDGNRIEEMHTNHAFRVAGCASNIGNGKRGGVRAKDGVSGCKFVKLSEDAVFEVRQFWNGFNHQIGITDRNGKVVDRRDVGRPSIPLFGRGFSTGDAFLPKGCDAVHAALKPFWKRIVEVGLPSGLSAHLSDTCAHGSCSNHRYTFNGHEPRMRLTFMMLVRRLSVLTAPRPHHPR